MKDILIISHFLSTSIEKGNDRFRYIADMIENQYDDCSIEIVTSLFFHDKKEHRDISKYKNNNENYKLTMLNEPKYKKNVSIKRFYSHFILGQNLKKYLTSRKKPDIIYCAVPSLDVALIASKYAKKNDIKFIIDIQDLWPEAFKMVFNIPIISRIFFKPIDLIADKIYKTADEIIAVSETYARRALKVNKNTKNGICVFLGTDLEFFDSLHKNNQIYKDKNEIWITYVGTLGHSYDLKLVMDALNSVKNKGLDNIKFIVMGDGPLEDEFKRYSQKMGINVDFTGRLEYGEMVCKLVNSDIAVNPITKGAAQSIINKVGDYAAAGIPVLNTQECEEYREIIEKYNCGINCNNGDIEDLSEKIIYLCNSEEERIKLGKNNRKLAEEKFNRKKTYRLIVESIAQFI